MELAGTLARELQELKGDLETDTVELKETEEAYDANLRQAKLAQREFEDKVRKVEKQLSQVKIKEAQAEAAAALSNVAFKVGDLGRSEERRVGKEWRGRGAAHECKAEEWESGGENTTHT